MTLGAKFGAEVAIRVRSTKKRSTMPLSKIWSHLRLSKPTLVTPPRQRRCRATLVRTEAPCKLELGHSAGADCCLRTSENAVRAKFRSAPLAKFRRCEVALFDRHPRSARRESGARAAGCFRTHASMVIPPLNSSALRAQYEHGRGEAGRFAAVDLAKTDARRTRSYAPSAGLVPTNAPPDRPGRLAERDRLGRLDVAPEQAGRRDHEHDRGG